MNNLVVGVDVDDVTLDLCSRWVQRYNEIWNDTISHWHTWNINEQVKPECGNLVYDILKEPDLYESVGPMEGALENIELIRSRGHEVVFITTCGYDHQTITASSGAKFKRLQELGFLPNDRSAAGHFIVTADKARVKMDLLVDDRADTIRKFGSRGIIYSRPHNADFLHTAGYRVRHWGEIPSLVGWHARFGYEPVPV